MVVLLFFGSLSFLKGQARSYPSIYEFSSSFELDSLDAVDPLVLDNLEVLGRVWGFVKYHHPAMADTTIHIDYELFGLLPRVTHAEPSERNRILSEWIESLGPYEVDSAYYQNGLSQTAHMMVNDFAWIRDTARLGSELSNILTDLRAAIRTGNRYVFKQKATIGLYDDQFLDKDPHLLQHAGFRLLILFRFWNAIDSYCSNRNITDRDWNEALVEYLPRMIHEEESFIKTYMELLAELDDTHATGPYPGIFGSYHIPVLGQIVQERLFVSDPCEVDLLQQGDEILEIDEKTVPQIIALTRRYTSQSNESVVLNRAADFAFWTSKDTVSLTFFRDGRKSRIDLPSQNLQLFYASSRKKKAAREPFRMINDSVAYMYIGSLQTKEFPRIYEAVKDTKNLIIDMRGYPSDYSVSPNLFGAYLFRTPKPGTLLYYPIAAYPGLFMRLGPIPMGKVDRTTWQYVENPDAYSGKIIILVNEETQSAAEYITMFLQAIPGAVTVGSQTAGADGDIVRVMMPGDLSFYFSSIKVLYPDGTDTQRVGVRVDYEVKPTVEGVKAGRDEVLEYALSLVD